jgi:rubrerythrin
VYQEIRKYLKSKSECQNTECKKEKFGHIDKLMIQQIGFCLDCVVIMEAEVKHLGLWDDYEKWRMYRKAIAMAKDAKSQIEQGIRDLKPYYEFVQENGTIEKWDLPKPMDEMRKEMEDEIANINNGLKELEEDVILYESRLIAVNNPHLNKLMNGSSKQES